MPYKDPEKRRLSGKERTREYRRRKHIEKYGTESGDMRGKYGQKGKKRRPRTDQEKENISKSLIGLKHSESRNIKNSKSMKGKMKGDKNPRWKGGVTKQYFLIRKSFKYKEWRQKVFIKDDFTCQKCGDNKGSNLNAHHIKSFVKLLNEAHQNLPLFSLYEAAMVYKPLWNVENGKTLCKKCHKKLK